MVPWRLTTWNTSGATSHDLKVSRSKNSCASWIWIFGSPCHCECPASGSQWSWVLRYCASLRLSSHESRPELSYLTQSHVVMFHSLCQTGDRDEYISIPIYRLVTRSPISVSKRRQELSALSLLWRPNTRFTVLVWHLGAWENNMPCRFLV